MFKEIRQFARSFKYQTILGVGEKININFCSNSPNFSELQIYFMHWWIVYHGAYQELNMGDEYLSEAIIKDDIRFDAYLLHRKKRMENQLKENRMKSKNENVNMDAPGSFYFDFKKPRKRIPKKHSKRR